MRKAFRPHSLGFHPLLVFLFKMCLLAKLVGVKYLASTPNSVTEVFVGYHEDAIVVFWALMRLHNV
jgi:hypothetical protein